MDLTLPWAFDRSVAQIFDEHVRANIPGYERVVDLSLGVVQASCRQDERIAEIGCATGYTLRKLERAGFRCVVGVDNSVAMLERCGGTSATLVCSDAFPAEHGPYSAVIMNWTLHFVPPARRREYLVSVRAGLLPGGVLVLTEKTRQSEHCERLYHDFKRRAGMSDADIEAKKRSLVGVLETLPPGWYLHQLGELGFETEIIAAEYGFVTFVARLAAQRQESSSRRPPSTTAVQR